MAKNIKVNNVTYNGVASISVPLAAGGGNAVFPDTSDATATAADIANGETAYVDGVKVTGTATGGGGGALTITVSASAVQACPAHGTAGDTVALVTKQFYMVTSIKDASNNPISFQEVLDNNMRFAYSFVMPSSNVSITTLYDNPYA